MSEQPQQPQPEVDAALMREYLDSRAEDQRQLNQLGSATSRLSEEIGGLRTAMSTYQTEIEGVRQTSVTKVYADKAHEDMLRNLVALRLRIRRRTNWLFTIAMAVLLAAIGVGAWVMYQQAQERHAACVNRNNGARSALPFYDREISNLNDHHSDPAVIDVLRAARATAQNSIVKC